MNNRAVLRVFAASFALSVLSLLVSCDRAGKAVDPATLRGWETRETMSPGYFTGKVARTYEIAMEIPEILDSLHCYCECKKHLGHKSLLTCYVNAHASDCDLCMDEALMADRLHKDGKDVVAIRKAVDKSFSRN
ncbi:MAG: hypothetical protein HY890_06425 [Deltaproteobacteria bacterium]|nr:hypothetical protein [Deltaproteobacteria bacterium]